MGKYINEIEEVEMGTSYESKINTLLASKAKRVNPTEYEPNLVCVVDNGHFAAAAYAYSDSEFKAFMKFDGRPKSWFILPNASKYAK